MSGGFAGSLWPMEYHLHADKPPDKERCSRQSVCILEATDRPAAGGASAGQRQYKNSLQFIDKSCRGSPTKIHRVVADNRPAGKSMPNWYCGWILFMKVARINNNRGDGRGEPAVSLLKSR